MGIKERRLRRIRSELVPRLKNAADFIKKRSPGFSTRVWAHELGRNNALQGFSAGIECAGKAVVIEILELHLFPKVSAYIMGSGNAFFPRHGISNESLGTLSRVDLLLEAFQELLGQGVEETFAGPLHHVRRKTQDASPRESDVWSAAAAFLATRKEFEGALFWPVTDTSSRGSLWARTVHPFIQGALPCVEQETFFAFHQIETEARLTPDESVLRVFTPSDAREDLQWVEFYGKHPDAPGILTLSRPGLCGTHAFLEVSFDIGFSPFRTRGYSFTGPGLPGDSRSRLWLLLDKPENWRVYHTYVPRTPEKAIEMYEKAHLAQKLESSESAALVGVDRIRVEQLIGREGNERRVDLRVSTNAGDISLSLVSRNWLANRERVLLVDRPTAYFDTYTAENLIQSLRSLLRELEPKS